MQHNNQMPAFCSSGFCEMVASGEGHSDSCAKHNPTLPWFKVNSGFYPEVDVDHIAYNDAEDHVDVVSADGPFTHGGNDNSNSIQSMLQKRSVTFSESGEVVLFIKDYLFEARNAEIIQKKRGRVSRFFRKVGRGRQVGGKNMPQKNHSRGMCDADSDCSDGEHPPNHITYSNLFIADIVPVPTKASAPAGIY